MQKGTRAGPFLHFYVDDQILIDDFGPNCTRSQLFHNYALADSDLILFSWQFSDEQACRLVTSVRQTQARSCSRTATHAALSITPNISAADHNFSDARLVARDGGGNSVTVLLDAGRAPRHLCRKQRPGRLHVRPRSVRGPHQV